MNLIKSLGVFAFPSLMLLAACGGGEDGQTASYTAQSDAPVTQSSVSSASRFSTAAVSTTASISELATSTSTATVDRFYRMRFEFSSSSDWAVVTFNNPDVVKAVRRMGVGGKYESYGATWEKFWLIGPRSELDVNNPATMTLDVALSTDVLSKGLSLKLTKGSLNAASLKISILRNGSYKLIREIKHTQSVPGDYTFNGLPFGIDPTILAAATVQTVPNPTIPKIMWAFYYTWYSDENWGVNLLTDNPLFKYDSRKIAHVQGEVDQALANGVNGFVSSWWGINDQSDQNFRLLLDAADTRDFKTSVYVETMWGGKPLPEAEMVNRLSYIIRNYGSRKSFAKVDNKPVIFLYWTAGIKGDRWKAIFNEVRKQGLDGYFIGMGCGEIDLDAFDGVHEYAPSWIPTKDLAAYNKTCKKKTRYHNWLSEKTSRRLWVPGAQPGYDDSALGRAQTTLVPRNGGAYYKSTLDAAINSQPDWVVITSWNEWYENTHIEDSVTYGNQYLDITKAYSTQWRQQ